MASLFRRKSGNDDLQAFYPIRPECVADVPKARFRNRAGKTLSPRRWQAAFSDDGHLDIAKVLRRIQRGGIHPQIKGFVWEFLLGCFDPNSTFDERSKLRERRREQFCGWKTECQNMVPTIGSGKIITTAIVSDDGQLLQDPLANNDSQDQDCLVKSAISDKKVLQWMLYLPQIGLDVVRTDRALVFYESEVNQAKLWDVLAIYSWVDNDIGYVQGMNDIASPMVILLENEADAYWCFEHAMRRLRENFRTTTSSIGVQAQLSTLSQIIKTIDPKLHQHLDWFQLMWAMEYNPNIFSADESNSNNNGACILNDKQLKRYGKFVRKNVKSGQSDQHSALAVFLVASVLETKNKKLLKEAKGLDDVVKILGDITGNLDAKKACHEALKIQKKYLNKTKK